MVERETCEDYVFHEGLDVELDDGLCIHCYRYLTVHCPHIDEFMEEEINDI